jgi:hypothetical protein
VAALFIFRDHPVHETKYFGIAGKNDVGTTNVKREPVLIFGAAEPSESLFGFKDDDVLSFFMQEPGKRKTREAAAKDCCSHFSYVGGRNLYC